MTLTVKHRATFEAVFAQPARANIAWRDIEALFVVLGSEISEGRARVFVSP